MTPAPSDAHTIIVVIAAAMIAYTFLRIVAAERKQAVFRAKQAAPPAEATK